MSNRLPVIGAALPVEELATYRDWLLDKDRDVELQSFTRAEVLDGDWRPLAEEANRLLDGHRGRRGIHGPFWGLQIDSLDPAIRAVVSRRMLQGLEVCAAVGATQMVVHSPYTAWSYNNIAAIPPLGPSMVENVHLTLGAAVKRAEETGVTIVIENIEDKDPSARVLLAESFNTDAVRVSLDTGHAHNAHGTGGPPVDFFVGAAGERLAHVHLQDADTHADRHWAIGEGTITWAPIFAALDLLETSPHLVLELRDYAGIPGSMAYLERAGLAQ